MTSNLLPTVSADGAAERELALRHQALQYPYTLSGNALLERQQRTESNARSYPRRIPLALKRAHGIYVEDTEGRVFIDCLAGAGTLALGHNHRVVVDAIRAVLDAGLPLHTLDLTTPVKDRFVQDLFQTLPAEFARGAKVQFCGPTGSDAVEAALKLVKIATGRSTMLAFHGAYHGMTQGALTLMGSLGPKKPLGALQGVQFLPYPYDYRCPFGLGGEAGQQAGLRYIETVMTDPEGGVPAAAGMLFEAVQGEGGVIPAPDSWLRGVRELTARAGVPLIVDEVQTGFGRTGAMFAFEHSGIVPDVLVLSKAIGGSLPLSVVVYRGELDQWQPGAHAGTFRGNQLAMAAGSATISHIRSEELAAHAARAGLRFMGQLRQLQRDDPAIGDVRGRGLMIGVEIIDPDQPRSGMGHPASAGPLAAAIQAECLRRGLIVELGGRNGSVVRMLPPLVITEAQLDHVFEIFSAALAAAHSRLRQAATRAAQAA
ncbi:diaminobutyrate--2-oxoglutarate transaminase [Janthinobacterium agaricidamnosum]|uniref:2,4-diaminobutyrate 4-transaminase family protein n=1 Tax=Janthinobacterium agaricidamnosum NBRC 102515 = DSM 9628 TaxID=1349767 RepID=W0V4U1_9BURK|nr:diaminobutyrate--2-oxoglutarate transaminase [Janthinobacterium agaricidamnosum]CDG82368.1 2,4-diaminobutyrate 4-transaminase family protein [Janthinobacterium agaricidamnosum NBRC 102515 = DSM 9628]